jgi:hypothetical protein
MITERTDILTAHTPGPWRVTSGPEIGAWHICPDNLKQQANPIRIANLQDHCAVSHARTAADARLIAAAPCLLDAAREALRLLEDPDADAADADRVTALLRAAIAKATGSGL